MFRALKKVTSLPKRVLYAFFFEQKKENQKKEAKIKLGFLK
jgi:hypothetical protein